MEWNKCTQAASLRSVVSWGGAPELGLSVTLTQKKLMPGQISNQELLIQANAHQEAVRLCRSAVMLPGTNRCTSRPAECALYPRAAAICSSAESAVLASSGETVQKWPRPCRSCNAKSNEELYRHEGGRPDLQSQPICPRLAIWLSHHACKQMYVSSIAACDI